MAFIEQFIQYLEQVASAPQGLPLPTPFAIDEAACRQDLAEVLERMEARDPSEAGRKQVSIAHRWWTDDDRVVAFATALARRLRESFGRDADGGELRRLIQVALARRIGFDDSAGTWTRTLELDRLAELTLSRAEERPWEDIWRYAQEIHATQVQAGSVRLAPIGRVCLDVKGRDAIRWLLHVEVEHSSGPWDPFRLCRATAAHLVGHPAGAWEYDPIEEEISGRHYLLYPASLNRLHALGLLTGRLPFYGADTLIGYTLHPSGQEILQEVAGTTDTPMRLLAHALVQDEAQHALAEAQPRLAAAARASAAESVARQARLVAHELHNALVPVRVALDSLYQLLDPVGSSAEADKYRGRIEAGLARAFRFVEETLASATLVAEERGAFDVGACLRDALAEINGEARGAIHLPDLPVLPPVIGIRPRFVLALVNLLRNAIQATRDRPAAIQLMARIESAEVVVWVDDNGPGVPPEHRHAIFVPGFKLRPDGQGRGQGLALVKEVVETEVRGTVSCEESPLGGARFIVRLPMAARGNG